MRNYILILALSGLASAFGSMHASAALPESAAAMSASAASPAQLVGTWELVRCDNVYPDGRRVELYGPNPQGRWMIDAQGHYMMQFVRAQRESFAANDKAKGTPEEYRAASLNSNAHYGRFSAKDNEMRTRIERASFPNWDGKEGKSAYVLDGDELTYTVASPSSGSGEGAKGEVVWRRLH